MAGRGVTVDPCAAAGSSGWQATLHFQARSLGTRTVIDRLHQRGPLVIQRPFYEPSGACQVYVLHPPGGIVGGDDLSLKVDALPGAQVLVTAPGASKIYRSAGPSAELKTQLHAQDDACLEWLPPEVIVYDGAKARAALEIELAPRGQCCFWEVLCLGRSLGAWHGGRYEGRATLRRAGKLLWAERLVLGSGEPMLSAGWGLAGQPVVGSMVATAVPASLLPALRELARAQDNHGAPRSSGASGRCSVTQLGEVLLARYLGPHSAQARDFFRRVWAMVRPATAGRAPAEPRVWAT